MRPGQTLGHTLTLHGLMPDIVPAPHKIPVISKASTGFLQKKNYICPRHFLISGGLLATFEGFFSRSRCKRCKSSWKKHRGLVQNAAPKASLHFCPEESIEILRWHSTSWHGSVPWHPVIRRPVTELSWISHSHPKMAAQTL